MGTTGTAGKVSVKKIHGLIEDLKVFKGETKQEAVFTIVRDDEMAFIKVRKHHSGGLEMVEVNDKGEEGPCPYILTIIMHDEGAKLHVHSGFVPTNLSTQLDKHGRIKVDAQ